MIGEKIYNYQINAHLGQGGMGNVFRATDNMLGREVALKMLHPQLTVQAQFLERFKVEARVLARLLHPNIAVIYNFIEQEGNHYMVMEYVEGTSLDDMLKKYGPLPAKLVVPIFIQALEGLQHAHLKQILHRDIKPSNLMLTPDGTLKLMDFGIAKMAGEQKMTQANKIVGTVEFMAPELIEGKPASTASDIYAMGVTLYELLSGKLPFESDTDYNLMQAIMKQKARPLDKLGATIPKALNDIVMKALEKNPDNRFKDARSFQQALIAAFPFYKEIDVKILEKPKPTLFSNQPSLRAATASGRDLSTVLSQSLETRVEAQTQSSPTWSLQSLKEKTLSNKKLPYILAAVGLLFFLLMFISSLTGKKQNENLALKSEVTDTAKKLAPVTETINTKKPANILPEQTQAPVHEVNTPVEKETVVPARKKKKKIEEENIIENKTPEAPVVKQEERKEVYINSRVEVKLQLQGQFEDGDREKDRPVSFVVSSPVVYNGVTIIRQGAVAKGDISLGRVITAIHIYSVTGANGQQLSFQSANFHRKRRDIDSDKSYEAVLEEGIRMSF